MKKQRKSITRVMPLALVASTIFSCNALLENDPRHFDPGLGDAGAGTEPSSGGAATSGGKAGAGGRSANARGGGTGLGGAFGAGASSFGGDVGIAGAAGAAGNDSGGAPAGGTSAKGGAPAAGGATVAKGGTANASGGSGAGGASASGGAPPATCPATVDCTQSVCDGKSCGANGRKCINKACACPSGTRETSCSDGVDNDCDGAVDCADSDCPERTQCGSAVNTRCCGGACVNTESDANNCQACGSKCASGKSCVLLSDSNGRRGHCQCAGTNSLCPGHKSTSPTIICRTDTPNANLCAQEAASVCPAGQTFVDVSGGPNFCRY